jgi:hypothetical protein
MASGIYMLIFEQISALLLQFLADAYIPLPGYAFHSNCTARCGETHLGIFPRYAPHICFNLNHMQTTISRDSWRNNGVCVTAL